MYCARSRASVRSSCASVGPYPVKLQEAATKRRLIAILVTHDVIDWLELCMCPLTVTFKYSLTKYSRMAADPRKPRTLNPAKIKAHTVLYTYVGTYVHTYTHTVCTSYLQMFMCEERWCKRSASPGASGQRPCSLTMTLLSQHQRHCHPSA